MILTEIVSQHVEEAAFLWLLRCNAMPQPGTPLFNCGAPGFRQQALVEFKRRE